MNEGNDIPPPPTISSIPFNMIKKKYYFNLNNREKYLLGLIKSGITLTIKY
jgi:hypothetical protein